MSDRSAPSCSIIIPARNEAGTIEAAIAEVPDLGSDVEIIVVEGRSRDHTWERAVRAAREWNLPNRRCQVLRQAGKGKADAVRQGFAAASGELLAVLDADLAVAPGDLIRFYKAARKRPGRLINGVRLQHLREQGAMPILNSLVNRLFSLAFSGVTGQRVSDLLCGTKMLWRSDYLELRRQNLDLRRQDPFGDFGLLFGAAQLGWEIIDLPVLYRRRRYGQTNICRWQDGARLLRTFAVGAWKLKFAKTDKDSPSISHLDQSLDRAITLGH